MRRAAVMAGAALACAVPAVAAGPVSAAPRERTYLVTFDLEMTRSWTLAKTWDLECQDGRCHEEEQAAGTERLQLRTPHPERVTVATGIPGQPPMFMGDLEATLRLTGHHRIDGTRTDVFSGAWDAANPDETADTSQCGDRSLKANLSFQWVHRNQLGLITLTSADLLREKCPADGWLTNLRGDDGVPMPDTMDVLGDLSQSKPGRVKDFSVRGSARWHGTVPSIDRDDPRDSLHEHGEEKLSWQWRATFRQARATKPKRRHR